MKATRARTANLSEQVAEEIRAMMARRRMTGARLARTLGVSPAWVSYRLTGTQPIDLNDLEQIARALDVDIRDLLPMRVAKPTKAITGRYPETNTWWKGVAEHASTAGIYQPQKQPDGWVAALPPAPAGRPAIRRPARIVRPARG